MSPEEFRKDHQKLASQLIHREDRCYDIKNFMLDYVIRYNNTSDVTFSITEQIISILSLLADTISGKKITDFVDRLEISFINKQTIYIYLNIKKDKRGLFFGRKQSNIFTIKRLLSNIAAYQSKKHNTQFVITLHHEQ